MSAPEAPRFVPLNAFVAVEEQGADALLGDSDDILVPEGGDVMIYGSGGAGKTTLSLDLAFHLAAGVDWCGIRVPAAVTVGVVENEGPRPLFRQKLRRKRDSWEGPDVDARLHVLENPWSRFTFADDEHRDWLGGAVAELGFDVVFVGPLTRVGMNDAGTLQETRDFSALLADVRARAGRPVTFALVHHENKGGQVSGAWEGAGDTLLHAQAQGHGRTRLYVQKARWASGWHGKSLQLLWAPGESFTVSEAAELDDNAIADSILATARSEGGQSWRAIRAAVGGNAARADKVRDDLLAGGRLIDQNAGRAVKTMRLWDANDPLCPVCLTTDTPRDTPREKVAVCPVSAPLGTQDMDTHTESGFDDFPASPLEDILF